MALVWFCSLNLLSDSLKRRKSGYRDFCTLWEWLAAKSLFVRQFSVGLPNFAGDQLMMIFGSGSSGTSLARSLFCCLISISHQSHKRETSSSCCCSDLQIDRLISSGEFQINDGSTQQKIEGKAAGRPHTTRGDTKNFSKALSKKTDPSFDVWHPWSIRYPCLLCSSSVVGSLLAGLMSRTSISEIPSSIIIETAAAANMLPGLNSSLEKLMGKGQGGQPKIPLNFMANICRAL